VDFDLIIAGGGPVGASLARAAGGLSVALVANERPAGCTPEGGFDARVYALSPGNVAFLRDLRAWQAIEPQRLTPVHAMEVFGDDGASALRFDAYRAGVPELAWIVEDCALQQALWRVLEARETLEIFAPAQCERLEASHDGASLRLADGRQLRGRLVVGADGARSVIRRDAGIDAVESGYGQSAVVANFECVRPHGNAARQWFLEAGVLALLPLPGQRVSMVWSLPEPEAARLASLPREAFEQEVARASRGSLGELGLLGAPRSFPLRRLAAKKLVAPRVALAGDAAHVIHPLAGQGLNLGLQDARALAAVLAGREPVRDPGDLRLLRRYERARAEPILSMDFMVDALFRLFGSKGSVAARMRNSGLNLVDRVPVLKHVLMRQAMG
jgi:2-octaprenylphenol hydroxylase